MNINLKSIITTLIITAMLLSTTLVTNAGFISEQNLNMKMQQAQQQTQTIVEKYAVIVIGLYSVITEWNISKWGPNNGWPNLALIQQYYEWYMEDAAGLYNVFKNEYGYDDEHIILLAQQLPNLGIVNETTGVTYFTMPDVMNPDWIDYTSDEEILKEVLNSFKEGGSRQLDDNDQLFFSYINHGNVNKDGDGFFGFPIIKFGQIIRYLLSLLGFPIDRFPRLYDYELAEYIEGIEGKLIFALQPCKSGSFIEELSGENRVILTSTRADESDNGWITHFRKTFNEYKEYVDQNGDEKISLNEAYNYSAYWLEVLVGTHPQIDDNGDGVGHFITDPEYDPYTLGMDGYLASSTFL